MGFQNQASLDKYEAIAYQDRTVAQHLTFRLLCLGQNLKTTIGRQQEQEWQEQLAGYLKDDIEYAYKATVCGQWFPSINDFKARCYQNLQSRLRVEKLEQDRAEQARLARDPTAIPAEEAANAMQGKGGVGAEMFMMIFDRFKAEDLKGDPRECAEEFANAMWKLHEKHGLRFDRPDCIRLKEHSIRQSRLSIEDRKNVKINRLG